MAIVGMLIGWVLGLLLTVNIVGAAGLPAVINIVPLVSNLWLALSIFTVLVALGYLFVSLGTSNGQPATMNGFAQFSFGVLIGLNAGANFNLVLTLAALIFSVPVIGIVGVLLLPLSVIAAAVLSLINALAAVQSLARSPQFAAVLGWSSWLMPMSWIASALGLLFLIINALSLLFGVRVRLLGEWWTGTVVVHGGVTYLSRTAYNLGNFAFVHGDFADSAPWLNPSAGPTPLPDPRTVQGLMFHETGHTLNVAACGGIFHYLGAIDENLPLMGSFAFAEQLAEGHLHAAVQPWVDWWRPQIASIGGAQRNAPANAASAATQFIPSPGIVAVGTAIPVDTATVPALATDADSYPQGSVNPGVIPAVGFLWVVGSAPIGSTADFAAASAAATTFTPDVGGDYVLSLHYSDGSDGSPGIAASPGLIPVTPGFTPAAASTAHTTDNIGVLEARIAAVPESAPNTQVQLSSAGTTAGTFFAPNFAWSVTTSPTGATAGFNVATIPNPIFTGDIEGDYVVTLVASVGAVSHTATAQVRLRDTP